jgi:hypothetical protein
MNPLPPEQMMSSFSASSIVHTTGTPLREYLYRLPSDRPRGSSLTGKTNRRFCASYRSQRACNAIILISVEDGCACTRTFFCDYIPAFYGTIRTGCWVPVTPMSTPIVAFALHKVINRSLSTLERKHVLRISGFGAERITFFL